jgi:predicted ArsR family transcriptional regulator
VGFLVDRIGNAVDQQAGEVLAADLVLETARPIDDVGYEPRLVDEQLVLENCPFDRVAREHTALVCGLNVDFVRGVVDGLGCAGVSASLQPAPGRCCVSARHADPSPDMPGPGGP